MLTTTTATTTTTNTKRNLHHVQNMDTTSGTPLLPHGHGHTSFPHKGDNSVMASVYSFACSTIGAGIVSLPRALEKGGYVAGAVIILVALMANFTAKRLVRCLTVGDHLLQSYGEIAYAAYGKPAYYVTMILQSVTLFGVCTIFLILFGINMHYLVHSLTVHDWVLVMGFVVLPISWLKSLKEIKWLGMFGIAASLFAAGVIIVAGFQRAADDYPTDHHTFRLNGISQAFNVIVFSFGGHSVLPSIALEMKDINSFPTMANIAYLLIGGVYCVVSVAGYTGYGGETDSNILLQISSVWGKIATALIAAHLFVAYPIPMYPLTRYAESACGVDEMRTGSGEELRARIMIRSSLVIGTVFVASVIPYFGDVLSLVSALSIVLIVFFFPLLFYMRLAALNDIHVSLSEKCLSYVIMMVGVVGTVVGSYYGFNKLASDIKSNGNPFLHFFTN